MKLEVSQKQEGG